MFLFFVEAESDPFPLTFKSTTRDRDRDPLAWTQSELLEALGEFDFPKAGAELIEEQEIQAQDFPRFTYKDLREEGLKMGPAQKWVRIAEEIYGKSKPAEFDRNGTTSSSLKNNRLPQSKLKILQVLYDDTFPLSKYRTSPTDSEEKNRLYARLVEVVNSWDDSLKNVFNFHQWWCSRIRNHNRNSFIDRVVLFTKMNCFVFICVERALGKNAHNPQSSHGSTPLSSPRSTSQISPRSTSQTPRQNSSPVTPPARSAAPSASSCLFLGLLLLLFSSL